MGGVQVLPSDVCPKLLIAVFPFHGLARLPLLPGNPFEMPKAVLIESLIAHKDRLQDLPVLSSGNHRKHFDVEVHRDRHQIRITLALYDLPGENGLRLQEM